MSAKGKRLPELSNVCTGQPVARPRDLHGQRGRLTGSRRSRRHRPPTQTVSRPYKACPVVQEARFPYVLPHPRPFPSELGKGDSTADMGDSGTKAVRNLCYRVLR